MAAGYPVAADPPGSPGVAPGGALVDSLLARAPAGAGRERLARALEFLVAVQDGDGPLLGDADLVRGLRAVA